MEGSGECPWPPNHLRRGGACCLGRPLVSSPLPQPPPPLLWSPKRTPPQPPPLYYQHHYYNYHHHDRQSQYYNRRRQHVVAAATTSIIINSKSNMIIIIKWNIDWRERSHFSISCDLQQRVQVRASLFSEPRQKTPKNVHSLSSSISHSINISTCHNMFIFLFS